MNFRLNWGAECCLANPGGTPGQAGESQSWCGQTGVPSRGQSCFQGPHIMGSENCESQRQGRRNSKLSLRSPTVIRVLGDIIERQSQNEEHHLCLLEKWGEIIFFFPENAFEKNPARVRFKKKIQNTVD